MLGNKNHRWLLGWLAACCWLPASAADQYAFDKVHTQILFFVNHLGFSRSVGEFHDYEGGFVFDPEDWTAGSVDVTIRTASIDLDDEEWDKHLRSPDFFRVEEFPDMRFKSTKVEPVSAQDAKVHGELTLLGVTRPVTLDVHFNKAGVHPKSKQHVAGFSAHTVVKRSDFGMNYAVPMVGDDVEVVLEVEGIRQEE